MGSATREFMPSLNCCLRARLTILNLSNSLSTGGIAVRAETLGGACLDLFERDDEGATGADVGAGDVVEVDEGTGSEMGNGETGSMWATVDMLGTTTVAEG